MSRELIGVVEQAIVILEAIVDNTQPHQEQNICFHNIYSVSYKIPYYIFQLKKIYDLYVRRKKTFK